MRTVLFGLGLALVGCGGITPMSGDYDGTLTLTADSCGMFEDAEVGDPEDFVSNIVFNEDGSVVFADADDGLECTADGAIVTCSYTSIPTEDEADDPFDGLVEEGAIELVWDSNTSFTGWQTLSLDCEGADCSVLEDYGYSFPCSIEWDLVGSMA